MLGVYGKKRREWKKTRRTTNAIEDRIQIIWWNRIQHSNGILERTSEVESNQCKVLPSKDWKRRDENMPHDVAACGEFKMIFEFEIFLAAFFHSFYVCQWNFFSPDVKIWICCVIFLFRLFFEIETKQILKQIAHKHVVRTKNKCFICIYTPHCMPYAHFNIIHFIAAYFFFDFFSALFDSIENFIVYSKLDTFSCKKRIIRVYAIFPQLKWCIKNVMKMSKLIISKIDSMNLCSTKFRYFCNKKTSISWFLSSFWVFSIGIHQFRLQFSFSLHCFDRSFVSTNQQKTEKKTIANKWMDEKIAKFSFIFCGQNMRKTKNGNRK